MSDTSQVDNNDNSINNKIDFSRPRYDSSTYYGRVMNFFYTINPFYLLVNDDELNHRKLMLERYKNNQLNKNEINIEELWKSKYIIDSMIHPDTGDKIPALFRWCAFVPTNVPIVMGMLTARTVASNVFWQWINQSYNVAVNYSNRNASNEMSTEQIIEAYSAAVLTSCFVSITLNKLSDKLTSSSSPSSLSSTATATGGLRSLLPSSSSLIRFAAPYTAVATAGALNCYLMRRSEMINGIIIKDDDDNVVGKSTAAGKQALIETIITRIILPAPVLLLPSLIMNKITTMKLFQQYNHNNRLLLPINVIISTCCLWTALPLSIGLFQQQSSINVDDLESKYQSIRKQNGQLIDRVYFNKGT